MYSKIPTNEKKGTRESIGLVGVSQTTENVPYD